MIVFFIRRFTDIDHLTPVIWAVQRRGEPVSVLSLNPYLELDGDYRLDFIRHLPGVTLDHVYTVAAGSTAHRCLGRALVAKGPVGRAVRSLIVERNWDAWRQRNWFGEDWARQVIQTLDADLLVFDWVKPEQHVTRELLAAADGLNVPTVALPHGVAITTGELRTSAALKAGKVPDYGSAFPFRWFVAPHHEQGEYFVRGGVVRSRMAVLGSARFCDEWVRKGLEIAPHYEKPNGRSAALKVVFMDKKSALSRRPEVAASVARIAAIDQIDLVIKPHTRNDLTDLHIDSRVSLAIDVPSVSLVAWADVVVGTTTSILIEPVCQGKPLVYPSHHSRVSSLLQEMQACWAVEDDDGLEYALRELIAGRRLPLQQTAIDAFLHEVVYAADADRDVLGRYASFLDARRARAVTPASVA